MRILLVDDDNIVIEIYTMLLEMNGFEVLSAKNGEEGLTCWKKHRDSISLVVTDYKMPGMDGDIMIKAIREIDPTANIIMQSCNKPDELNHIKIPDLKIHTKPYIFSEILSLIKSSLPAAC